MAFAYESFPAEEYVIDTLPCSFCGSPVVMSQVLPRCADCGTLADTDHDWLDGPDAWAYDAQPDAAHLSIVDEEWLALEEAS